MAKDPETVGAAGEWEVVHVADNPRPWTSKKGGEMLSWRIGVKLGDNSFDRVELTQKTTTAAPTVGQKIEGHVQRRFYEAGGSEKADLEFRKAARFAGGGGGGGGRAWKPRPDDAPPVYAAKQAQIVAQHSQNMALRVLELAHASGDDWAGIMADLGVPLKIEVDGGESRPLGLVEAFSRDASVAAATAWKREADRGTIRNALADLG